MRRLVLGILVLGCAAVFAGVMTRDDEYVVLAEFVDAGGLRVHSRVMIAGQPVGTVRDLRLGPDDRAVATLAVESGASRPGSGASVFVRPANLLGEKFVELEPGDVSRPLPSGTKIPVARTSAPVELDDVLDVLDSPTRAALAALINESGLALTGRSRAFNRTLIALPPALDRAEALTAELGRDTRVLGRLVEESDRVVGAIAAERDDLGLLVSGAHRTFATIGTRHSELAATVRAAPSTLRQLRGSLARLQGTALALGPASDALRSAAPSLSELLETLPGFAEAARPTLRTAAAVAPKLDALGLRATPVLSDLVPAGRDLANFARSLDGFSASLNAVAPRLLAALEGWARAIQVRDGAGHLFRNNLGFNDETLQAVLGDITGSRRRSARDRDQRRGRRRPAADSPAARPQRGPSTPGPGSPLRPKLPVEPELPGLPPLRPPDLETGPLLDFLVGP